MARLDTQRTLPAYIAALEKRIASLERARAATSVAALMPASGGYPAVPIPLVEPYGMGRFFIQSTYKRVVAFSGATSNSFWCWVAADGSGLSARLVHPSQGDEVVATSTELGPSTLLGLYVHLLYVQGYSGLSGTFEDRTLVLDAKSSGEASYVMVVASGWGELTS